MEPILEEGGSERSLVLDANVATDSKRDLAFKSGFLSLQERLSNWNRQSESGDNRFHHERGHRHVAAHQFANLHEFFQSKSSLRKQLEQEEKLRASKRPKLPIMKLSKEDWNVRCWEERTRSYRGSTRDNNQLMVLGVNYCSNNRLQKPELQVKVFHGRVDEVAKKLEKVREGRPLDEQLYKLEMNKMRDHRREHSWTDQLKQELSQGTHDRKVLKWKILEQQTGLGPSGTQTNRRDQNAVVTKSVLGRPIRRLFDDD